MPKSKKRSFSKVKAIKANARARVGTPPPERVEPDPKREAARAPRHRETLARLLATKEDESEVR